MRGTGSALCDGAQGSPLSAVTPVRTHSGYAQATLGGVRGEPEQMHSLSSGPVGHVHPLECSGEAAGPTC